MWLQLCQILTDFNNFCAAETGRNSLLKSDKCRWDLSNEDWSINDRLDVSHPPTALKSVEEHWHGRVLEFTHYTQTDRQAAIIYTHHTDRQTDRQTHQSTTALKSVEEHWHGRVLEFTHYTQTHIHRQTHTHTHTHNHTYRFLSGCGQAERCTLQLVEPHNIPQHHSPTRILPHNYTHIRIHAHTTPTHMSHTRTCTLTMERGFS